MGTHPIFESDFDCLTDLRKAKMKRISDLKVPELHDELTKRGLSKKGKKQELINVSNAAWAVNSFFFVWAWC